MSVNVKSCIKKFYNTSLGRKCWLLFVEIVNNKYIRYAFNKALQNQQSNVPNFEGKFLLPKINTQSISFKPKALFIMPFYGSDAVGQNNDLKVKALRELGYEIHTVMYNNAPWEENSPLWDFVYHVKVQNETSFQLKRDIEGNIVSDGHKIDDWCGDELVQFIGALDSIYDFDLAIVNYVFLSKVTDVLRRAIKYLDTHDVFANRNSRMLEKGVAPENFYFSTSKSEEKIGLDRFDYVIAIQESEGEYFRKETSANVVVTPPVFDKRYIRVTRSKQGLLIVGFLASGHYPNIVAIKKLLKALSEKEVFHSIRINIAGSICPALSSEKLPEFATIKGFVDNLEDFYSECDVIVNPDELLSGLKVKSLEALSFGKPLICTKEASMGIHSSFKSHNLKNAEECANFLVSIINNNDSLELLASQSREVYDSFVKRYNVMNMFKQTIVGEK